jgi:LuxR family maltose regulon positive regulatory protein
VAVPLLQTKLYISPLRSQIVPRPHLIERLNAALACRFTLISAPAGFGKTTLLREWISDQNLSIAWFSIDRGDNDPVRFWMYVIAALQTLEPEVGKTLFAALQTSHPPSIESLLIELINEITDLSNYVSDRPETQRFILILDDYHLITETKVHDSLVFLLDHLPPRMHLIISGRSDPPWHLAGLRARRIMVELRVDHLRFTSQEVVTFLNSVMRLEISPEEIAALEKRTEGWIVGLQMAALSMQRRSDISAFIRAFTGTHRFILDYLLEEVLDRQSAEIQDFLLRTSILEQMTAKLCDSVLGRSNSHAILAQLEQANLFLVPLDDRREWYRYHHLFSELLRNQLSLTSPDEIPALHRKASEWFEKQGFIDETISHAYAARDYELVARLCEKFAIGMLQQSKHNIVSSWIEALPEELVRERPWLCVYQAWTRHWSGMRAEGEACLEIAERNLETSLSIGDEERRTLEGYIAAVRAHYSVVNEQLPVAIEQAKLALGYLPEDDYYSRCTAIVALGGAYWGKGLITLAERAFSDCAATALKGGFVFRASSALCYVGVQQVKQAKLIEAETTFQRALSLAQGPGERRFPTAGYPLVKLSELACEWNHLDQAIKLAEDGVELCTQLGHVDLIAEAYAALARVQLARADFQGLQFTLDRADQLSLDTKLDPWVHTWFDDCKIRFWLLTGNFDQADRWIESSGLAVDGELNFHYDLHHINLARVLVARLGQVFDPVERDKCKQLLARLLAATDEMGWLHHKIQVLILQAMALDTIHDREGALGALHLALTMAEPARYVRTFIGEGKVLEVLLRRLAAQKAAGRYVEELLQAFAGESCRKLPEMAEPLSPREVEVMDLLITSLSVPEIAEELILSTNTVRTHIKNIYSKLGVHRRLDAINKAKELKLV